MNHKAVLKIALEVNDKLINIIKNECDAVLDEDLKDRLIFLNEVRLREFTPCVYVIKNSSDEYATRNWKGWTKDINKARTFSNPGHAKLCSKYSNLCKIVKVELKEL